MELASRAPIAEGFGMELLLHALPLDGSMWAEQQGLMPATHAPTLYALGDTVSEWAAAVLSEVQGRRLIVAGSSVGGSCALEMAALAPDRIAGLVLIGTKAGHRPDPVLHTNAVAALCGQGVEAAWEMFWASLFSR
jgi:pimeloyl-ACP methyl ester carboxylesterase